MSESESCSVVSDSLRPPGLYSPWNSPGQNTGVGSLSLLQGIFPTQGSNPGLLDCRQILYCLSHQGRGKAVSRLVNSADGHHQGPRSTLPSSASCSSLWRVSLMTQDGGLSSEQLMHTTVSEPEKRKHPHLVSYFKSWQDFPRKPRREIPSHLTGQIQ